MKTSPVISVIVPCYNYGKYLEQAIESILAQTFLDYEIVVVDDGSTDQLTKDVLRTIKYFGVRVIRTGNRGLAAARNLAIKQANGEFIVPLDADDKIQPEFLEKCYRTFLENPQTGFVYTGMRYFGDRTDAHAYPYNYYKLLFWCFLNPTGCYRKKDWSRVGGYNEKDRDLYGYEDWEFWIRFGEMGIFGTLISEPLFLYRKHGPTMLTEAEKSYVNARLAIRRLHPELYNRKHLRKIAREWGFKGIIINADRRPYFLGRYLGFAYAKLLKEDIADWRHWVSSPLSSLKKIIPRFVNDRIHYDE